MQAPPDRTRTRSYNGKLKEAGKRAEKAALDFLNKHPQVDSVQDVRNDKKMQSLDVDFVAQFQLGGDLGTVDVRIEVKSDKHVGKGNILFELCRAYLDQGVDEFLRQGWSWFSKAQYVIYWSYELRVLYWVKMSDLREGLRQYLLADKPRLDGIDTDNSTRTFNVYIPEKYVAFKAFNHDEANNRWVPKQAVVSEEKSTPQEAGEGKDKDIPF